MECKACGEMFSYENLNKHNEEGYCEEVYCDDCNEEFIYSGICKCDMCKDFLENEENEKTEDEKRDEMILNEMKKQGLVMELLDACVSADKQLLDNISKKISVIKERLK